MARTVSKGFTRTFHVPRDEQRCTATLPSGERCKKRRRANDDLYCHLHAPQVDPR